MKKKKEDNSAFLREQDPASRMQAFTLGHKFLQLLASEDTTFLIAKLQIVPTSVKPHTPSPPPTFCSGIPQNTGLSQKILTFVFLKIYDQDQLQNLPS